MRTHICTRMRSHLKESTNTLLSQGRSCFVRARQPSKAEPLEAGTCFIFRAALLLCTRVRRHVRTGVALFCTCGLAQVGHTRTKLQAAAANLVAAAQDLTQQNTTKNIRHDKIQASACRHGTAHLPARLANSRRTKKSKQTSSNHDCCRALALMAAAGCKATARL